MPTPDKRDRTAASGFRLTARHLRVEEVPWRRAHERADGLVLAIRMLAYGEHSPRSALRVGMIGRDCADVRVLRQACWVLVIAVPLLVLAG